MGRELPQRTILTSRVTIRCERCVVRELRPGTESPLRTQISPNGTTLVRTSEGKQISLQPPKQPSTTRSYSNRSSVCAITWHV